MQFSKLPSGKTLINSDGRIIGVVAVPSYDGFEDMLDKISEAAVGGPGMLRDFGYENRGVDLFLFSGSFDGFDGDVDELFEANTLSQFQQHADVDAFMGAYALSECEFAHMLSAGKVDMGQETIVPVHGSNRDIRIPVGEIDYIRVTIDGYEVAYWSIDEVCEDPSDVIGAVMGASNSFWAHFKGHIELSN